MIRREFGISPKVSIQQFLSVGYTLNKAELTCIIINKVIENVRHITRLGMNTPTTKPESLRYTRNGSNSQNRLNADQDISDTHINTNGNFNKESNSDDEDANPIQYRPNPSHSFPNIPQHNLNAKTNLKHSHSLGLNSSNLTTKKSISSSGINIQKNIPPSIQKNIKVVKHDLVSPSNQISKQDNFQNYQNPTANSLNKINPSDQYNLPREMIDNPSNH